MYPLSPVVRGAGTKSVIRDALLPVSEPEVRALESEEFGGVQRHVVPGFLPRINRTSGREAGAVNLYVKALLLRDGRTLVRGVFFFEQSLWTDATPARSHKTALNPPSAAALGVELRVWDVSTMAMHRNDDRSVPDALLKLVPGRKIETYSFPCPFGVTKHVDGASECRRQTDGKQPISPGVQMIEFRADLGRLGQELSSAPEIGVWLTFGDWRRGVDLSSLVANPEIADLGAVEDDTGRPGEFDPYWYEYRNTSSTGSKPRDINQRIDPTLATLDVSEVSYVPSRIDPEVAPFKRLVQSWRPLITHDDFNLELVARLAQHALLSGVSGIVAYVHPTYDRHFVSHPTIRRLMSAGALVPVRWQVYSQAPGWGTYEQIVLNAHTILSHWGRNCMLLLTDVDELVDLPSRPEVSSRVASPKGRALASVEEDALVEAAQDDLKRRMFELLGWSAARSNASSELEDGEASPSDERSLGGVPTLSVSPAVSPVDGRSGSTSSFPRRRLAALDGAEHAGGQGLRAADVAEDDASAPPPERPVSLLGSLFRSRTRSILDEVTSRKGFYANAGATSLLSVKTTSGPIPSPGDLLPPATPRQARLAGIFSYGGCLHRHLQAEHSKKYGPAFVSSLRIAGCASINGLHTFNQQALFNNKGPSEAELIVGAKDLSKIMPQFSIYLPNSTWQKPIVNPDAVSDSSVHRAGECVGYRTEPWGRAPPGGIGAPLPIQRRQDGAWNLAEIGIPNQLSNRASEPPAVRSGCKFIRTCPTIPRQCVRLRHLVNLFEMRYKYTGEPLGDGRDWSWIYRERDWTRPFPK